MPPETPLYLLSFPSPRRKNTDSPLEKHQCRLSQHILRFAQDRRWERGLGVGGKWKDTLF